MRVPNGDRRHGSESGGVVNEKDIAIWNDHVVSELILRDHLSHDLRMNIGFRLRRRPSENFRQPLVARDGSTIGFTQSAL